HFIMTGGTIDSAWNGRQDAIVVSENSCIPEFFQKYNLIDDVMFTEVCMKDSRQLTDEDRSNMVKAIQESPATKIVITHGTFTMPDTARFLKKHLKRADQTIILTGSTTPLKSIELSDGGLNLGFAISHTQTLSPNVYIAMKGKAFTIEEIEKNI